MVPAVAVVVVVGAEGAANVAGLVVAVINLKVPVDAFWGSY